MKNTPQPVKRYLSTLEGDHRADGYISLNEQHEIIHADGWVGTTNLNNVDASIDPVQSLPILEGLLPVKSGNPTVIEHAHVDRDYYFDIHLFHDNAGVWVLFVDKTRSAKLLQKEQQIRLDDDFINAKRRTGS